MPALEPTLLQRMQKQQPWRHDATIIATSLNDGGGESDGEMTLTSAKTNRVSRRLDAHRQSTPSIQIVLAQSTAFQLGSAALAEPGALFKVTGTYGSAPIKSPMPNTHSGHRYYPDEAQARRLRAHMLRPPTG